jgi:hypothetical protein
MGDLVKEIIGYMLSVSDCPKVITFFMFFYVLTCSLDVLMSMSSLGPTEFFEINRRVKLFGISIL